MKNTGNGLLSQSIFHIFKKIVMGSLCLSALLNAAPPETIPSDLYDRFTDNGTIPVTYIYKNETYPDSKPLIFDYIEIEKFIQKALRKECGHYGYSDVYLYQAFDKYASFLENKEAAVMGSQTCWFESMLLAYHAKPTTIEYNKIISSHPKVKVMTVDEYNKNPKLFDVILSYSSYEHDGLGRYGDPINPEGDLIAMEKTKHMLREGGLLFLTVPIGQDRLVWNLHRIYGPNRLPKLLAGWEIIDTFGFSEEDFLSENEWGPHQPTFVLRPIRD